MVILIILKFVFYSSIAYPTVQMATHAGKCVFLHTLQDDGEAVILGFKLVSQEAANGLYRYITLSQSYFCDTPGLTMLFLCVKDVKP